MIMRRSLKAVALEYGQNTSPVVSAKAEDEMALSLLQAAREHGVHVAQDPQLAEWLSRLEVGQEIPEHLYTAVAVILSWVYWLKGMQPGDEKIG
jgi:flagellar biosynthesis protein